MTFASLTSNFHRFRPRILDSFEGYTRAQLATDVSAGITVGVVALPLAMAFGIASGVKPEQGIFTAIIAGVLISALGGSRVQIGGPAGAFVALLYGIAERYGEINLLLATSMAGVVLFAVGLLRLGSLIRFIPVSIVTGFTNGIAVIIAFQQLKDFLGLRIEHMPANFVSQVRALASHLGTFDARALGLGAASLALIVVWPKSYKPNDATWKRWMARVPGTIVVLVAGVLAVRYGGLEVETIGRRFGGIPRALPTPVPPHFEWETARNLTGPILSIAMLGAIESLVCARVADGMIEDRHDPNQELMAQGLANFIAPIFGGIAATGTIARTVTNIRAGGRTPVAGLVHALTLLLVILALAPLASDIPLCVLSAILLFVAYNMGEWSAFARLKQFTMHYRAVLLATFLLTVIFDVSVAVEVGLLLAALSFIVRVSNLTRAEPVEIPAEQAVNVDGLRIEAWRMFGALFFGSVTKLEQLDHRAGEPPAILVLELHQVINLDATGLEALEGLYRGLRRRGGRLILAGANEQPLSILRRTGFVDALGPGALHDDLASALDAARQRVPDGLH